MEINKVRIEELNKRFSETNVNLCMHNSISQKDFNDLSQFGTMWNFNFMSAAIWFNENKIDHELDILLNSDEDKRHDKHVTLFNFLLEKFTKLDNEVNKAGILNKEVLEQYIPILLEHQKVARSLEMVNRWPYTTYMEPEALEDVIAQCEAIKAFVAGELSRDDISNGERLDGNHIMRHAWMCIEWGLYDEAEFITKTLIDFATHASNVANLDSISREIKQDVFLENGLDLLTTCIHVRDIPRFDLSIRVAYGKIKSVQYDDETAKDCYLSCVARFPFGEFQEFDHIHYWTGHTRIMEMAIELWILETDKDEKELIKDNIETMFFKMRELDKPNNLREAFYEQLLVIRMLIDTVYAEEE